MCWLWREPSPAPGTLATKGLGPLRTQRPPWKFIYFSNLLKLTIFQQITQENPGSRNI
uniref:Uncharacterized protein n=1 Tax=Ursus maritimus TaxID=29073 RepID=A0A452UJQ1_URSMA